MTGHNRGLQLRQGLLVLRPGRDVTASDAGDVYMLFDDRVTRAPGGISEGTLFWFATTGWRWNIAVATVQSPSLVQAAGRNRWAGLVAAAVARPFRLPWKLGAYDCPSCDPVAVSKAKDEAIAKYAKGQVLIPGDVVGFLSSWKTANEPLAQAFLDDLLIKPQ